MSIGSRLKLMLKSTLLCITSSAAAGFYFDSLVHARICCWVTNQYSNLLLLASYMDIHFSGTSYNLISLLLLLSDIEPYPLSAIA